MADKSITADQVRHVAKLASLHIEDDEAARLSQELGQILGYMAALDELDLRGVEPTFHSVPLSAPARPDVVVESRPREVYLASAPRSEAGGFAVPKVLDGEG